VQELTKMIAQALVDAPQQVSVTTSTSGHTFILNLKVGRGDAGKIIGKQGRTISAFRTILNAVAAREKKRVILEIADDDEHRARLTAGPRIVREAYRRMGKTSPERTLPVL
jgi:predicted RNA-binding protein YlqC (UPF0109 family)